MDCLTSPLLQPPLCASLFIESWLKPSLTACSDPYLHIHYADKVTLAGHRGKPRDVSMFCHAQSLPQPNMCILLHFSQLNKLPSYTYPPNTPTAGNYFAKDLPRLMRSQSLKRWDAYDVEMLKGKTMGIIG